MDREGGSSGSCYYSVLGICKDASCSDIRPSYRKLALCCGFCEAMVSTGYTYPPQSPLDGNILGTIYGALDNPKLTYSGNVKLRASINKISLLKVGLKGKSLSLHTLSGSSSVEWVQGSLVAHKQPLTWYKATFNSPEGFNEKKCQTNCGQPSQIWYAIVRDMTAAGLCLNKFCYAALIAAHNNKEPVRDDIASKIIERVE
ncbi:hypothetical protein BC332_07953 [Capsicum chinense]|nr:hypothetical protein BC332_07953 [Capsicum chinense]